MAIPIYMLLLPFQAHFTDGKTSSFLDFLFTNRIYSLNVFSWIYFDFLQNSLNFIPFFVVSLRIHFLSPCTQPIRPAHTNLLPTVHVFT